MSPSTTRKTRLEKDEEKDFVVYAESIGYLCLKLRIIGISGAPDRILLKGGRVIFFEMKKEGKKPRGLQTWFHNQLRKYGCPVFWADSAELAIDKLGEEDARLFGNA